jgi:hypothetical protein
VELDSSDCANTGAASRATRQTRMRAMIAI